MMCVNCIIIIEKKWLIWIVYKQLLKYIYLKFFYYKFSFSSSSKIIEDFIL